MAGGEIGFQTNWIAPDREPLHSAHFHYFQLMQKKSTFDRRWFVTLMKFHDQGLIIMGA